MSSYHTFYIRTKENKFYPIYTCHSHNALAEVFECPYGQLMALNKERLSDAANAMRGLIERYNDAIKDYDTYITAIMNGNNTIDEKLETIEGIVESSRDTSETIKSCKISLERISFFDDINEEVKYDDDNKDLYNKYLYVGYEVDINDISEDDIC